MLLLFRRLILFLQQSSVEWASSLWMHVVQELDPQYQRTASIMLYPNGTCSTLQLAQAGLLTGYRAAQAAGV
jgi:hypothetical protein